MKEIQKKDQEEVLVTFNTSHKLMESLKIDRPLPLILQLSRLKSKKQEKIIKNMKELRKSMIKRE